MADNIEYIGVVVGTANSTKGIHSSITPGGAMVMGQLGVMFEIVKVSIDAAYTNSVSPGDVLTIAGAGIGSFAGMALVTGASLPVLPALLVAASALVVAGGILNLAGYRIPIFGTTSDLPPSMEAEGWRDADQYGLNESIHTTYRTAAATRPAPTYRDPLAIDLDGDGIETVGIGSSPVTFDHDADGVRTDSGWVSGDDAWVVFDRNGNGSIDSGREPFGVDTLKSSGLDALRDLGSNADGVFSADDAAIALVRLWRDVNQDGISQASELTSLSGQGIASIHLAGSAADGTTQQVQTDTLFAEQVQPMLNDYEQLRHSVYVALLLIEEQGIRFDGEARASNCFEWCVCA